ncbi:patatin-like phospholipase family protein [Photobacterium leiognathi]|uniref:patatin-like phospholipase family protein n=1 Tax=Photobacterium leiognathi TaxID=553611 RepID=UPI00298129FC|nr:patatin-like phospholipase family protein [Photobacterium leiognathi]
MIKVFKKHKLFKTLLCFTLSVQTLTVYASADDRPQVDRKRVGLVLSGGGAKGAAHIGVLEVLEKNRIPVDIVTGTSMGAYVGGMYAMGFTAKEVKRRTFNVNWQEGYLDRVNRNDLTLRRKQQNDNYQLHTDIGLDLNGEFKARSGAFQGQGFAKLLRQVTDNLPSLKSFDQLAIPYRSVATDIAKLKPVILNSGHLATAMQASMTVPGALKPVHLKGKLLVDGGVVNNMPVNVAQVLGAENIIAVDLRDNLMPSKDLDSALNIVAQLTTYMTNASADEQKGLMKKGDVYLQPDVSFMTAADFDQMTKAYEAGKKVAEDALPQLLRFQLSKADYQAYVKEKQSRRSQLSSATAYYIDEIKIRNNTRLPDRTLRAQLALQTGQVISNESLEQAVKRLQSEDIYGRITYKIDQVDGKNILDMDINEKSWGPGYLNFTLAFEDDFVNRSNFSFGAQYLYTDLTDKGGEWLTEFSLGSWKNISTEFYFPLDYKQQFFTEFGAGASNEVRKFNRPSINYADGNRDDRFNIETEYRHVNGYAAVGWNLKSSAEIALGYSIQKGSIVILSKNQKEDYLLHGPYINLIYDDLDSFYFPSKGLYANAKVGYNQTTSEFHQNGKVDGETYFYDLEVKKPFSFNRHTVAFTAKVAGSDSEEMLPIYAQALGGMFNLSGYHRYELNGRYSAFASMIYRYRLLDNNFGAFKLPVYVGGSLEQGGVWDKSSDVSWGSSISAGSVYVAVDSILGPVYLSYGLAEGGQSAFYLSLGGRW